MAKTEVVVRAGIPGMQADPEGNGEHRYPADVSDFVKLLRERGCIVSYEHEKPERTLVEFKAFEIWMPILDFTANVAANVPANIVSTLILDYLQIMKREPKDTTLHLKYLRRDTKGNVVEFEADGRGPDVLKAIEELGLNDGE